MTRSDEHQRRMERIQYGDPFSVVFLLLCLGTLAGIINDLRSWGDRTALGKAGYVLSLPVWILTGLFGLCGVVVFGTIILIEQLPGMAFDWYDRRAFKDER